MFDLSSIADDVSNDTDITDGETFDLINGDRDDGSAIIGHRNKRMRVDFPHMRPAVRRDYMGFARENTIVKQHN